jgi:hypothetical protein
MTLSKETRGRKKSARKEEGGEQTGSNLIIRNAPELENEGLSFRLTPSGRRCYSFVCSKCADFLSFSNFIMSLFFRYSTPRPMSKNFAMIRELRYKKLTNAGAPKCDSKITILHSIL